VGGGPAGGRIERLIEQPTARERDAARFLPSRLTVPEIARELGISTNTLKTHLKGLYRKLGVTSRRDAITVARELGVIHDPQHDSTSTNGASQVREPSPVDG
jgi:DNA-binding CsgD family transcriptional regulator